MMDVFTWLAFVIGANCDFMVCFRLMFDFLPLWTIALSGTAWLWGVHPMSCFGPPPMLGPGVLIVTGEEIGITRHDFIYVTVFPGTAHATGFSKLPEVVYRQQSVIPDCIIRPPEPSSNQQSTITITGNN
jgi:hypothetical protein